MFDTIPSSIDSLRHRAVAARRAQLRHLLPPAQRSYRVPRRGHRRQRRELGGGAAAAPRERRPRQGHLPLHQLAGRLRHGGPGHPGHHGLHQVRRVHHLPGRVRVHGRRAAVQRRQGQAHVPAELHGAHPPAVRRRSGPADRDRHRGRLHAEDPQPPEQDPGGQHGPDARDHPERHRARQLHDRRGGRGLRPGRPHHHVARRHRELRREEDE